jgi:CRISPR-associated exonuclease Cas4
MGVTIGLALLLVALLLSVWGLRLRRTTGLPWAPVLAQDTYGRELEKPLFAKRIGLTGKPDYVLDIRGSTIPVEVKPGRRAARPYESDLMQLAAYCLLLEETSDTAPPYGLLRYAERTFRLDYTPQVRDTLLALLDDMRAELAEPDCARSHDDPSRCWGCGFFEQCDDALVDSDQDDD